MCETRQAAIGVAITDAAASGLNRRQQIIIRITQGVLFIKDHSLPFFI